MSKRKELWIGLVEVIPDLGNEMLEGARGAFTNAVTLASSASEYNRLVKAEMKAHGFQVRKIVDGEPLSVRCDGCELDPNWREIADKAAKTGQVVCGEFFSYLAEEDKE